MLAWREGGGAVSLAVSCLLAAVALAVSPWAGRACAARPNVLLLLTDDQRPDTIHALGNPQIATPHLDALARRGVACRRAVCPYPICTPSRAEILTGCSSFDNGVFDFGGRIDPSLVTWPQALRRAGYHTWYVGKWHNDGRPRDHGYDESVGLFAGGGGRWAKEGVDFKGSPVTGYRGWVFQDDQGNLFPERGVGLTPTISCDLADAAIGLLRRRPQEPFFLHVNFTAPHDPLLLPPGHAHTYSPQQMVLPKNFLPQHPFDHGNFDGRDEQLLAWPRTPQAVREVIAAYYAVLSQLDEQIGRILAVLEETQQSDRTIVIFTSDHGVAAGSHGLRGKQNMYEHTVGVPLLLAGPGLPAGRSCDAQLYLRDLYPTVCELAGVEIPATVRAKSLVPVLAGRQRRIHPHVFCYFRDKQRMLRTDRWKLIHYPQLGRYQLFDLQHDPDELHDLAADPQREELLHRLQVALRQAQVEAGDPLAAASPE